MTRIVVTDRTGAAREIDADLLIYQDLGALKQAVRDANPRLDDFDASCFDGRYITGDVTDADFATLQAQRRLQFDEEEGEERSRLALQSAEGG